MILLSGHSLTAGKFVAAESMSLQLKEKDSTANLTPVDMDGIGIDTWMKDDREPGAGIVWKVRSIQEVFNTRTPTVQLEHVIGTLKDRILFGEVTPATITETAGATTCTARQAIEYILSQQSDWQLGDFEYENVSNPYKFDGDTLFDALETVTNSLDDAMWTYNLTAYPFKVNIVARSSAVGSEMRAGRNMRTINRTIDKSGMYTRFYPIGKDDLHLTGQYVERNTGTYGVISKVETDNSLETEAELTAWANQRLAIHAEPVVTITVEGLDLSQETGEPMDSFQIGRVCRVPLPEFGTVIEERITELSYPDKVHQPSSVRVTMANTKNDVTRIIADALKRSGKRARGSSRKDKQDLAWFEDTNDHVSMTAIGIIGVDAEGKPDWTRMSEFIADGEGLHAKVETEMNGITDRVASLEISESQIRSDVAASNSQIYSYIIQTASSINSRVSNQTNRTWIQDTDPRNSGATPKAGDIWVESTHHGTWDGAEGFDWEHDEDYDWAQIQGAKIWGWQNDKWELVSDQQQVVTMTDVEQTSEHVVQRAVKAMVNDEGNLSVYRAELRVEGDQIRSEVHEATSQIYSFILQTASQITIRVGESNMVFSGKTKPTGTAEHPLVDGDLWFDTNFQRIWADMEELDAWIDDEDFDWSDMKGSKIYVYDAVLGDFREVMDEQVLAQDTDIDETAEHIALVARSVKSVEGKVDVYRAEFKVEANQIKSSVNQRLADVGSTITQTATQIRAEVHAAQSSIYSSITQTASQIRAEVVDTTNGLSSSITQTASAIRLEVANSISGVKSTINQTANQIRAEVNAANSTIYSSITQTASQIRSEVASSISGVNSSITQTASAIRAEVANSISGVKATITQTASQIRSEVSAANSTIYSTITQTASTIRTEVANSISGVKSTITQTANSIRSDVSAAQSTIWSSITQSASKIALVVDGSNNIKAAQIVASINNGSSSIIISANHINLDGYVKATDLTTNWLEAKIAGIESVGVKNLAASGAISIKEGNTYYAIARSIQDLDLSLSGNTYTLKYKKWDDTQWQTLGTFSRATSLSAAWDGNRKFTVSASPQGNSRYTTIRSSVPDSKRSISGGTLTATIQATIDDSETFQDIGNVTIGVTSLSLYRRQAGRSASGQNTYYGKLYYWDADAEEYIAAYSSNAYWYSSSTNLGSGSHSVFYL